MMKRYFNIAGPCIPGEHYLLPILARCPELAALIQAKQYFVIHAARQAGKTTLLNALEAEINAAGQMVALYCSLESVQGLSEPERGIPAVIRALERTASYHPLLRSAPPIATPERQADFTGGLQRGITDYCRFLGKPLILLFDEADCLSNQTLITFLRQLRDGLVNRTRAPFPSSIALVGMRNLRDYKANIRSNRDTLGSASPFNIITKSLTLSNFTRDEIGTLYAQHTTATGQSFTPDAVDRASYWTAGQPWLVNAIARECVEEILQRDLTPPVTAELVNQAAENLLRRRGTHLDSLYKRLKEERVRRIVEPVITGADVNLDRLGDDCQYVLDLGLLRSLQGVLLPANPLYAEVILRMVPEWRETVFQMVSLAQREYGSIGPLLDGYSRLLVGGALLGSAPTKGAPPKDPVDTPVTYLTRIRRRQARHWLENTDLPIARIAELTGFNNPYCFSLLCRRLLEDSPTNLRRKVVSAAIVKSLPSAEGTKKTERTMASP